MPVYNYKKGTFSNSIELNNGMNKILIQAQKNTLERMKEKLDDFISEDVYMKGSGDEDDWYQRTFDLYNIWETNRVYVSHGKIYGSIEPTNTQYFSHNASLGQHSTPTRRIEIDENGKEVYRNSGNSVGWKDLTTKDYVHIINDGLDWNHSMFGDIPARPFWDDFKKWAEENYNTIFKEELQKLIGANSVT